MKKLWEHIKGHELQDPNDKRQIRCDEKMQAVFKQARVDMFNNNKTHRPPPPLHRRNSPGLAGDTIPLPPQSSPVQQGGTWLSGPTDPTDDLYPQPTCTLCALQRWGVWGEIGEQTGYLSRKKERKKERSPAD